MIDLGCKMKMASSDTHCSSSPRSSSSSSSAATQRSRARPQLPPLVIAEDTTTVDPAVAAAYEQYLRLPELAKLWRADELHRWAPAAILRPALQGLEITFRFVSVVLSDPRPYADAAEWTRRLECLALRQIELIAALCGDGAGSAGDAPVVDLVGESTGGVLTRGRSSSEVWAVPGEAAPAVSRTSEESLLPRLAAWRRSAAVAAKIGLGVECCMGDFPFTLGVGEPNLGRKPSLDYDLLCKPSHLHVLKNPPPSDPKNPENEYIFTAHQIFECWVAAGRELLRRLVDGLEKKDYHQSAADCWLLERFWKLFSEIEDLHLLMDPFDILRLKNQLGINAGELRSAGLAALARSCKELRHRVPAVVGAEADPGGGPRVQEAAMRLFRERGGAGGGGAVRVHVLQAFQAVEAALKRFFFGYREMVAVVMGSLEATGKRPAAVAHGEANDKVAEIFREPAYFPSLDAAKTFLGSHGSY